MKILIAPDKFKGSLSALEVCQAIHNGLTKSNKAIETIFHPMADGGDGSLAILANHLKLKRHEVPAVDPMGRPITAAFFTSNDTAFIEMASASGLVLLIEKERNPLLTTTLGTGKMIAAAIAKGYQKIMLFLGGSATNDAGMGIATALGYQFLDAKGNVLAPIGGNLGKVVSIISDDLFKQKIALTLLCDVTNPLYGREGAAHIYAGQKGADEKQINELDAGLEHFGKILERHTGMAISHLEGSGAAGGIGAGLVALFGAKLTGGFNAIAQLTGLEEQIEAADWVISGEGQLDEQSLQGKVIGGVAALCRKDGKPLSLFVGRNSLSEQGLMHLPGNNIYAIADKAINLEDAMTNGADYLERLAVEFWERI